MHLNFTILDKVRDRIAQMAPRGKKVKEGVAKQMKKWERNVGLKIMLTMGYIIGCGLGKALIDIKWPVEIWR